MDDPKLDLKSGDSLPPQDFVIRYVESSWRDKINKNIPAFRCFTLSSKDKEIDFGLSVEWEKKTTPEDILIRIGLSKRLDKNGNQVYKNYLNRELYAMNVGFLRDFKEIRDVQYKPELIAEVKNPAHSLVLFTPETYEQAEVEIIPKIRDHAAEHKIAINFDEVKKRVDELRESETK